MIDKQNRYNLLDEVLRDKPFYEAKALTRYIDTRSFMRRMLKARSDAAEALQRYVEPEAFDQIKRNLDELSDYEHTFYFACGLFKAYQMYLQAALPDLSTTHEDVVMETERLHAQSDFEDRLLALRDIACLTGALKTKSEGDPVANYSVQCYRVMMESNIYHFTYGLEYGIRACKLFDDRYNEDAQMVRSLYDRLDITDKK